MNLKSAPYLKSILVSIICFALLVFAPFVVSKVPYRHFFGVLFALYIFASSLIISDSDALKKRIVKLTILHLPVLCVYFFFPLFQRNYIALPLGFAILLSGLLSFKKNPRSKYLNFLLILLVYSIGFIGYPKYSTELNYRKSFLNKPLTRPLEFIDSNKFIIDKSKPIILEFWNSACSQCIKEFPNFEDFYSTSKNDYNIYSVNIPWERDSINNFNPKELLDSLNYDFPVLSMSYSKAKEIGVNYFPTVVYIDNNIIKYKGRLVYNSRDKYNFIEVLKKLKYE